MVFLTNLTRFNEEKENIAENLYGIEGKRARRLIESIRGFVFRVRRLLICGRQLDNPHTRIDNLCMMAGDPRPQVDDP